MMYLELKLKNVKFIEDYLSNNLEEVKMILPEGTYLVWLDFRDLGMEPGELKNFQLRLALQPNQLPATMFVS